MNIIKAIKQLCMVYLLMSSSVFAGEYQGAMQTHPSQGPITTVSSTNAKVFTYKEGVALTLQTKKLTPGHAYTLWFAVMNKPEKCADAPEFCTSTDVLKNTKVTQSDVVYAGATIADENGEAFFNSFIESGEVAGFWFGRGLTHPLGAEIHLVINDHGPVLFDLVHSMLTSYRGGCTDESLPEAFPGTAKADGIAGPNSCRLVQMVRFKQH